MRRFDRPRGLPGARSAGFALVGALLLTAGYLAGLMAYVSFGTALGRIESDVRRVHQLARAKQALLGYAASYAEQHSRTERPETGPGYLPCPDIDGDGSPDPACPRSAAGDLPWRHLGIPPETPRIRYTLSAAYRSNPTKHVPLNTETRGELTVGTSVGIAALVKSDETESARHAERAADPGPREDTAAPPGPGDAAARVLTLSDRSLGRVMEARALVAVARALDAFRAASWNAAGSYPWLQPELPSPAHRATVGAYRGAIAVHEPGLFATGFTFEWPQPELYRAYPADGSAGYPLGLRVRVEESEGQCAWEGASVFHCEGTGRIEGRPLAPATPHRAARVRLRVVAGHLTVRPPDATSVRTRGTRFAGELPPGTWVEVSVLAGGQVRVGSIYRARTGDSVRVEIHGVRYALATPEEIPDWFVTHRWHRLVHVAVSRGHGPGGDGRCGDRWACLRVRTTIAERHAGAVVIGTGAPLEHQLRGESATLDDFLEGTNAEPDGGWFVAGPADAHFNDRVRLILGASPTPAVGAMP